MKRRRISARIAKTGVAAPPLRQPNAEMAARTRSVASSTPNLSTKEKAVLRDIWLYASGLGAVTAVIGLILTAFSLRILVPIALVCVVGAVLLHIAALERFHRAHRHA